MSVLDHGGADIAFEMPSALLLARLTTFLPPAPPVATPIATAFLRGDIAISAQIIDLTLGAPDRVTLGYRFDDSVLTIRDVFRRGRWVAVEGTIASVRIDANAAGNHSVEISGTSIQVRLSGSAGSVAETITVMLDRSEIFQAPLIEAILWEQVLLDRDDPLAVDRLKEELAQEIERALPEALARYLSIFIAPQLASPAGTVGVFATAAAFAIRSTSLLASFAFGGSAGTPSAIARSSLRSGPPPDRAGFVLSNASLLRDIFRPIMIGAIGMGTTGFIAGHPCWSTSPVPFGFVPPPRPGVTFTGAFVDSLVAGVTEAGGLRVLMALRITYNLFTVAVGVDLPIAASVTKATPGLPAVFLLLTPGTPTLTARIDMPPWAYALSALLGGAISVAALALADAIVDALAAPPPGLRVAPPVRSLTLSTPWALAPLTSATGSFTQSDAPARFVTIGGATRIDPFRVHDLIVTLA